MGFYPYENYYIETNLSPKDIENRLSMAVERKRLYSLGKNFRTYDKPYNGWVQPLHFAITKNVSSRNVFLPQIEGVIIPGTKTQIHIVMKLQQPIRIFMMIFIATAFLFGLGLTLKTIMEGSQELYLIPSYLIAAALYMWTTLRFKYQSSESKNYLNKFLESSSI